MTYNLKNNLFVSLLIILTVVAVYSLFSQESYFFNKTPSLIPSDTNNLQKSGYLSKSFAKYSLDELESTVEYSAFSITYPSTWEYKLEKEFENDPQYYPREEITFSKGDQSIVILRAATGGKICNPAPSASKPVTTIHDPQIEFRITNNPSQVSEFDWFIVCEKGKEGTYTITSPINDYEGLLTTTSIGAIKINTVATSAAEIDHEIIQILQSIEVK